MGASASVNRAKNATDNSDESDNNNDSDSDSGSDSGSERVSECGSGSGEDVCPNKTLLPKSPKKKKKYSTYFTPEELKEIKSIEEMQKKATTFISNHFYYGVPVIIVRQSVDPYSPVFVQPDANLALERVHASQLSTVSQDWSTVKSVPTTVMVSCTGKVVISFEKIGINYEVSIGNLMDNIKMNSDKILDPDPPTLTSRTRTSLTLGWDSLPDPPGLSQYVDVQYSRLLRHKNKTFFKFLDKTPNESGIYDCDEESLSKEPWLALVSKTWDTRNFTSFVFSDLTPGSSYVFRLRYRNHKGWSEFSGASRIYRTEPGAPSPPVAPLSDAIMPHAVHLRWAPPSDNNGSDIVSYILEGRGVGDTFTVLFSGMRLAYVVFNLHPQSGYNFQVSAVNGIGTSTPSTIYSILTPALLHAPPYSPDWRNGQDFMTDYLDGVEGSEAANEMSQSCYANAQRCRDAWAMHYDTQTNQMFYFNVLTGSRQLNTPGALQNTSALLPSSESQEIEEIILDEVEIANEKKKAFRTKRFRFVRDVHINRKQKYKELQDRHSKANSSVQNGVSSGAAMAAAAPFTLPVMRDSLLSDTYKAFSVVDDTNESRGARKTVSIYNEEQRELFGKLTRKLRIVFHQEAGIDAGGLGKEFYLLLSEQMLAYMGKNCRALITLTESGNIFFNENFCEEVATSRPQENISTAENNDSSDDTESSSNRKGVSTNSLLDLLELKVKGDDFCQFFGRMIGKAIYDQQMLTMPLCGVLLAHIIAYTGEYPVEASDNSPTKSDKPTPQTPMRLTDTIFTEEELNELDSSLFKSLDWIRNNNPEGVLDNTFTVVSKANRTQSEKEINLCKDGHKIDVTESNKLEYIKLLEQWKTTFSINNLLTKFLNGFWEIIPLEVIKGNRITKSELDLILNGKPIIDVEEIRAYTTFQGEKEFSDNHPQVIQLWQVVREFEEEHKRLFLFFVTGTSRVPLDGYDPPFNITQGSGMDSDSLPRAHTCFNQLVLPHFSSLEIMREKVLFAIRETEGFQLS